MLQYQAGIAGILIYSLKSREIAVFTELQKYDPGRMGTVILYFNIVGKVEVQL